MNKEEVLKSINDQCQYQLNHLCEIFEREKIPYKSVDNEHNADTTTKIKLVDINLNGEISLNNKDKIYRYHFTDTEVKDTADTDKDDDPSKLYDMFHSIYKTLIERYPIDHCQKLDKVIPPNTMLDWLIIGLVCLPTLCYLNRSVLYGLFGWNQYLSSMIVPILDNDTILITIIILEFVTHSIETYMFLIPKLKSCKIPSKLWPRWIIWGVIEGYGPVRRIDNYCQHCCNLNQDQNSILKPLLVVDKEKKC